MGTEFVLFDFDGVIANTEESNAAYLEKALSAFGIQLTDDERKALIGTNDKARIESLLSRSLVKVTAEDLAGKRRQVGNTYENSCIRPMPGVVSLIQEIRGRGMKTGLVTSTSTRLIMIALNRMTGVSPAMENNGSGAICAPTTNRIRSAIKRQWIIWERSLVSALCLRIPLWAYTLPGWQEPGWRRTAARESSRM